MPKILYNFASRSRPDKLIACIENIISLTRNENYTILLTLDIDDHTVANKQFHLKLQSYGHRVTPVYGFSKSKIDAINKNVWMVNDWDIVVNVSDDIEFTKEGFDLEIISDMAASFIGNDGFLHYPDSSPSKEALCTVSIMGRSYFDFFGYIYHPDYYSLYGDNEATDVAKKIGKYKFINKSLFIHNHPRWTKEDMDDLYQRNEAREAYAMDNQVFQRRKKMNFGL